jgi:uncharacterized protein YbjT (DUF2867 family)
MKIVIIGGTGLIGSKLAQKLRAVGHEIIAASPSTGVNALTGEGLAAALDGAQVVVDVANSPSFENAAVLDFFTTSTRTLLAAEAIAGVQHHIALSVVGLERAPESGYFQAKLAQEKLIKASPIPYTILRATQFFEFLSAIAYSGTEGQIVRLTSAALQPIAAADVAATLSDIVEQPPLNGTLEVAGPEIKPLDQFVRRFMKKSGDDREVITDVSARYFGALLDDTTITTGAHPILGATRFEAWLAAVTPSA